MEVTQPKEPKILWFNVMAIGLAVVVALLIRTFWIQPFHIPSGSMIPTLLIGDNILVSKGAYGYTRYSFPFGAEIPYFSGKIREKEPSLGDVVVFRSPRQEDTDFVKRVVGREGDHIQMRDGILYINGIDCSLARLEDVFVHGDDGEEEWVSRFVETLPNGFEHVILKRYPFGRGPLDNTREFIVPKDHIFVMGDNRDGSSDSRTMGVIGYIPVDHIIGQARSVFFSTGGHIKLHEFWKWFSAANYSRIFQGIE